MNEQENSADSLPPFNPILARALETGMVTDDDGTDYPIVWQIPTDEGQFLQRLVMKYKPKSSLEIGLAYGISSMFVCDAHKALNIGAKHTVIDIDQSRRFRNIGMKNLIRAGYKEMVELHELPSARALPLMFELTKRFDFAFIDGSHKMIDAFVDFFFVDKLLEVGGIVVVDDANMAAVRTMCRYVASQSNYKVIGNFGGNNGGHLKVRALITSAVSKLLFNGRLLKDELTRPDIHLGIVPDCRAVAFQKLAK